MHYRQEIAFSLILGPDTSGLRGIPIFIGVNPLECYLLPYMSEKIHYGIKK
jgi:hypothetical protein